MTIYAQETGLYLVTASVQSQNSANTSILLNVVGGRIPWSYDIENHFVTAQGKAIGSGYMVGASLAYHAYFNAGDTVELFSVMDVYDWSHVEHLTLDWRADPEGPWIPPL